MSQAIEIHNLQKVVDNHLQLDLPELVVEGGELVAALGAAGSGRDLLFDLLIGRQRPTAGHVRVAGSDPVRERSAWSQRVGVLFEQDTLYKRQTVVANLTFQCRLYGLKSHRAHEVLDLVGLADHSRARTESLSPGMLRRLGLGRALVHQPDVLILAEPLGNCDSASTTVIRRVLQAFVAGGGAALVLDEHEGALGEFCDHVYRLDHGQVVESYAPAERRNAALPFRVPVRTEGSVALVNPGDILYVTVEESRTYLQTRDGRLPTQFTMVELEERLLRSGFFRAHRGFLVNLQHVTEVIPYTRNSYSLRLDDDQRTTIPLSKSAAGELRELLGY